MNKIIRNKLAKWSLILSLLCALIAGYAEVNNYRNIQEYENVRTNLMLHDIHSVRFNDEMRLIDSLQIFYNFLFTADTSPYLDASGALIKTRKYIIELKTTLLNKIEGELNFPHKEINVSNENEYSAYLNFLGGYMKEKGSIAVDLADSLNKKISMFTLFRNLFFFLFILFEILSLLIKKEK